jgi:type III pantothenate kinase
MLLVDVGNTRVKWARLDGDTLGPQSAAAHAGWSAGDWHAALFAGAPVGAVLAGSVAGEAVNADLEAATRGATGRGVRFVASSPEAAGVRNGYADPTLLGVDRWLAVIGACALIRGARVVVDIGTAATVDLVDADGRHRGGYIVPGPTLMSRSLRRSTADLAQRHAASGPTSSAGGPADNTRDAIERGACLAVAALVDRCVADATVAGGRPGLVLTGGDAVELLPWLRTPAEVVPDLVLRGLRELVRQGIPTELAPGDTK